MKKNRITNNNKHSGLGKIRNEELGVRNKAMMRKLFLIPNSYFLITKITFLFSLLTFLLSCVLGEDIETLRKRAQGNKSFTVSFEANGGLPAPDAQTLKAGKKAEEPVAMSKDGFSFGGWFKEAAFENHWDFDVDTVGANITLYAKWIENSPDFFTVSFNSNGGTEVDPQSVMQGALAQEPEGITKAGFIIEGWYKESGLLTRWDFALDTVGSDITLYAKWDGIPEGSFVITFVSNGGSPVSPQVITQGGYIDEPVPPARTGYL